MNVLQISSAFIQKTRSFLNFTCLHDTDVICCAHILSPNERNYISSKAMISILCMKTIFYSFKIVLGFYNLQNLHLSNFIKKVCGILSFLKRWCKWKSNTEERFNFTVWRENFFLLSLSRESEETHYDWRRCKPY